MSGCVCLVGGLMCRWTGSLPDWVVGRWCGWLAGLGAGGRGWLVEVEVGDCVAGWVRCKMILG